MHVERVDVASGFGRLEWDALLEESPQSNVFLTRPWLEAWWTHLVAGQDGYVLAVKDDKGQLSGVAPLILRENRFLGLRELNFMGAGAAAADHLDFIRAHKREIAVTAAICQYLRAHSRGWDILRFTDLREDSPTAGVLQQQFGEPYICVQTTGAACPYLPLSGSWQTYLEQQSGNFRQQTRSKRRKFEKQPKARFVTCRTQQDVKDGLRSLFQFNPQRWQAQGATSAFADRAFQEFHLQIAARFLSKGWLDLSCLKIEDQVVAVLYSFVYRNKVYYYNAGFDPRWSNYSLGRVLMAYHIQRAFDRGFDEYDFLRGTHSYKYAWTSLHRRNRDVMVLRRSPKTLAWHRIQRGLHLTRRMLKQHLLM